MAYANHECIEIQSIRRLDKLGTTKISECDRFCLASNNKVFPLNAISNSKRLKVLSTPSSKVLKEQTELQSQVPTTQISHSASQVVKLSAKSFSNEPQIPEMNCKPSLEFALPSG